MKRKKEFTNVKLYSTLPSHNQKVWAEMQIEMQVARIVCTHTETTLTLVTEYGSEPTCVSRPVITMSHRNVRTSA